MSVYYASPCGEHVFDDLLTAAQGETVADLNDTEERKRLTEAREEGVPWRMWGPYLSERQWGTALAPLGP